MIGRLVWYGDFPLNRKLELLREVGYEYVELSLDYPFPDELNSRELEDLLSSYEMNISFHSPLDVFVAQPRDEIFEASLKIVERCLDFASKFETLYYNFHITYFSPTREFDKVKKKILENGRKACEFILSKSEEYGFHACLEYDRNFDEKFLVDGLRICLDIGHFALANKKNFEKELRKFVAEFGSRILVCHVHDCEPEKRVDHISLRRGKLDFQFIFSHLKAEHYTIETFWRDSEKNELRDVDVIYDYEVLKGFL